MESIREDGEGKDREGMGERGGGKEGAAASTTHHRLTQHINTASSTASTALAQQSYSSATHSREACVLCGSDTSHSEEEIKYTHSIVFICSIPRDFFSLGTTSKKLQYPPTSLFPYFKIITKHLFINHHSNAAKMQL